MLWVSWSGKNTMIHLLSDRHDNVKQILSYKTRPLRECEIDGVDYHYMTPEHFQEAINQDVFLEHAQVYDLYYYGTKKIDIYQGLLEWNVMIKEMDMHGLIQIAENHPDVYGESVRIFLDLSEGAMIDRITHRAPISEEEVERRLAVAEWERTQAKIYCTHVISAEWTIEEVYQRVYGVISHFVSETA